MKSGPLGPKIAFSMMGEGGSSGGSSEPSADKPETEVSQPVVPTVGAIDWGRQPPIPADKIDWQGQGEPLRVRPTFGTLVTVLVASFSIIGAGAMFYWGVRSHCNDTRIHLKPDGTLPDLLSERYETRTEARAARARMAAQVEKVGKRVNKRVDELDRQIRGVSEDQQKILREIRRTRKAVSPGS